MCKKTIEIWFTQNAYSDFSKCLYLCKPPQQKFFYHLKPTPYWLYSPKTKESSPKMFEKKSFLLSQNKSTWPQFPHLPHSPLPFFFFLVLFCFDFLYYFGGVRRVSLPIFSYDIFKANFHWSYYYLPT